MNAVSGGIGIFSSLLSGYSKYEQGQAEQKAYDYNAAIARENAQQQVIASREKTAALIGAEGSAYGKAGVDIASGSPLLVMAHTAAQGGLEQARIKRAGEEEATIQEYYGQMAAYTGTISGVSNFLSGLSGVAKGMVGFGSSGTGGTNSGLTIPLGWGQ